MAKKMGRPTENPAVNQLRIRLTDSELGELEKCCELSGKSKTDIVRQGIRAIYEDLTKK